MMPSYCQSVKSNAFEQEGLRIRREQDNLGVQIGQAHEKREALTLQHQQSTQLLAKNSMEQQTCAERLEDAQKNLAARQAARNEGQERIRQMTQEIDSLRETLAMDMDKCHKAELILGRTQSELEQMQHRDDELQGESGSIQTQYVICRGWFLPPNTIT